MKYTTGKIFDKFSYPKITPIETWIKKESDKIPPIIDSDTFYTAKEMLENKVHHITKKGIYAGKTEFCGLLVCENCGSKYHGNVDEGRKLYNCVTKRKKGSKVCNNPNISLKKLKDEI